MKSIKTIAISSVAGILVGASGMYYFMHPQTSVTHEVITSQISGAKIEHRDFTYGGDAVRFTTESQGVGVIATAIPKANIPEAALWMNATHGLMGQVGYLYGYSERKWYPQYSMMYMHRVGRLQIGAGPVFSQYSVGAQAAVMLWF